MTMGKYGQHIREDKSVLTEPRCPFCRTLFERPREVSTILGYFSGGTCGCGAVFSYDPTRKNMGEAFMDALAYACNEDWDLAQSLESEKDFEEKFVVYRENDHTLSSKAVSSNPKDRIVNMIFVKLKNQQTE
ncbi:MAG: hypothetical protein HQK98_05540 [Nitrospirae bacterium]|nr:hypothetical protein [Nitrospirota bacterium]